MTEVKTLIRPEDLKASDLRVGNLFYPINRTGKVHLVNKIPFEICMIGIFEVSAILAGDKLYKSEQLHQFKIYDIAPIKLTPDWLERGGFDDDKRIDAYSNEHNNKSYFLRANNDGTWNFYSYNGFNDDRSSTHLIVVIEFLHDLQNTWKVLTKQELTFKP